MAPVLAVGVGVGWPCSAGYCVGGLWSSGDPGGACVGGLGTAGMCREWGAVVMRYSAKHQFGQKHQLVGGLFFTFYTIGWANTV